MEGDAMRTGRVVFVAAVISAASFLTTLAEPEETVADRR